VLRCIAESCAKLRKVAAILRLENRILKLEGMFVVIRIRRIQIETMNKNEVVDSTTTAIPPATFTLEVTFNTAEWHRIAEATDSGSYSAYNTETFVKCTMTIRRHDDGRTLVSYQSFENETPLSAFAIIVPPENTTDAIDWACAHLLANASGFWRPLAVSFREQYAASPAMKAPPSIVYKGYNFNTTLLNNGIRVRVGRRPPSVSSGQ
jgi:hypothetical protein